MLPSSQWSPSVRSMLLLATGLVVAAVGCSRRTPSAPPAAAADQSHQSHSDPVPLVEPHPDHGSANGNDRVELASSPTPPPAAPISASAGAELESDDALAGLPRCRLQVRVIDPDSKEPVPALVRVVHAASGKAIPLAGEFHRANHWYSLDAAAEISVPAVALRVEAMRGLDTELTRQNLDLTGQTEQRVELPLRPFYDARFRGLRAGNTHLHLMNMTADEALRYLRVVPQSDGLDLVFLSHLRRVPDERHYTSNAIVEETLSGGGLRHLESSRLRFGVGQEHRHNFGRGGEGFGHVMLLNIPQLIPPVSIGPGLMESGTDGLPLRRGIEQARQDDGTVIWCHNMFGFEDVPNWLGGVIDAQNIFDGGNHGSYEDTFYRYLNVGLRVPFSTGTDWLIYDFARVYVPLEGDLTSGRWLSTLREGRSFITNGPFLEFETERGGVGDTLDLPSAGPVTFVGKAMGRADFAGVELVYNGKVVHHARAQPEGGYFVAELRHAVDFTESGWVALRIPLDAGQSELGKPLFAHTSPIYVAIAGQTVFRREVAEQLIGEIQRAIEEITAHGQFADTSERETVLNVYSAAISQLKQRLAAE